MAYRQHVHQRGRANYHSTNDRSPYVGSLTPNSTTTPSKWDDVAAEQEGSFDKPGTPRIDRRAGYTSYDSDVWNNGGIHRESTPTEDTFRSENNDKGIGYRGSNNHPRISGADASADRDTTWEQCGLAVDNKAAGNDGFSSMNRGYQSNERAMNETQASLADRGHGNGHWPSVPPSGPSPEICLAQKGDVFVPNGLPSKPSRNPDNYDGNRAALDGSRVFYAAIIPPVPVLEDISNHAEYIAWMDKLRSTLRYHQLTPVITRDVSRPHAPIAAKRWDQDRLRAALIIKGALGYKAFEIVCKHGWEDTEDPAGTLGKIRVAHGAACPCSQPPHDMTLLDL